MSKRIDLPEDRLRELYAQNLMVKEIAKIFDVSEDVVRRNAKKFGLKKTREQWNINATKGLLSKHTKEELSEIRRRVYLERYGVDNPSKIPEFRRKAEETCLKKFGVRNVGSLEKNKNKMRQWNIEHDPQKDPELVLSVLKDRDSFRSYIANNNIHTVKELCDILHYSVSHIDKIVWRYDSWDLIDCASAPEKEVGEFISNLGVKWKKDHEILKPFEIDIYCQEYNIGIEFNGNYWHSDLKLPKKYHENKSKMAQEKGIRLIHIYEYEWKNPVKREIIKSLLRISFGKVTDRIYARNCDIREISNAEARDFNNNNHLQGHRNAQITYGLFYNDKLVQLMSFSKHRTYGWEIIRGCPGSNNIVVGGVSKLFKHFIREHNPDMIFSYCDFNKFDGKGYEAIGMEFIGYTGPNLTWVVDGNGIPRSPKKRKELQEIADCKIWGAGSKKYLWKKDIQKDGK